MEHYAVESVLQRRVCADSGMVEYLLDWAGCDESANSWEPRRNLVCCSDAVANFDAKVAAEVSQTVEEWSSRKRARSECPIRKILVARSMDKLDEHGVELPLGEFALAPVERVMRSTIDSHPEKKVRVSSKHTKRDEPSPATSERWWQASHADTWFRLCCSATIALPYDITTLVSRTSVMVVGLVPRSVFVTDGSEENPRLMGATVRDVDPKLADEETEDEWMVAYTSTSADTAENGSPTESTELSALPLSVFRELFSQELIDYLIRNSGIVVV